MTEPEASPDPINVALAKRHVVVGYGALALFVLLGIVLESLHAFKVPAYLDVGHETRRLLLRLAHAHGALIAIVQIGYGLTARAYPRAATRLASASLLLAQGLVPLGFGLGAISAKGGDPGPLVLLLPPGAVALFAGLAITAVRLHRHQE